MDTGTETLGASYDKVHDRLYPDYRAGLFCHNAPYIIFFNRVNALVNEDSCVLNYGAGRGKHAFMETPWKAFLSTFKGRCKKVVGVDVDPAVLTNPQNDENHVIDPSGPLPFEDESFDVIYSWAVFEHIENPEHAARELERVLKPGGWICAWTPNKWGYVGLGSRLIPNRMHAKLLSSLGKRGRLDEDVFPVQYKMNTRSALKTHFPKDRFAHHVALLNGPPGYHANSAVLARLIDFFLWLSPALFATNLHIFLQKKADDGTA